MNDKKIVGDKTRFGDWESDTMEGAKLKGDLAICRTKKAISGDRKNHRQTFRYLHERIYANVLNALSQSSLKHLFLITAVSFLSSGIGKMQQQAK